MTMRPRPQCQRKLWPYQVRLLRQMRKEGFTRSFLAELFGLSPNAVQHILSFSTYRDIK
jgi:predicted transcriptional regulator